LISNLYLAYIIPAGPANATLFSCFTFIEVFNWFEMGYASALAWLLFIIILILTAILWTTSARWVYYEGEERQ
jgi:multiple sugar transport system permease protein